MGIVEKIQTVIDDCNSQADQLNKDGTLAWDCNEVENWENMADLLSQVVKALGGKNGSTEL